MGSASSKAAKAAGSAAKRHYPQRIPPNPTSSPTSSSSPSNPLSTPGPTVHPKPYASGTRDEAVIRDAADPDFARSLRSIGPVTPFPMYSQSSAFNPSQQADSGSPQGPVFPSPASNPAIQIVEARSRLAAAAEDEFSRIGRPGFEGREYLDIVLIRQAIIMRNGKGMPDSEIEKQLGLKAGVMKRLGRKGIVGDAGMGSDRTL